MAWDTTKNGVYEILRLHMLFFPALHRIVSVAGEKAKKGLTGKRQACIVLKLMRKICDFVVFFLAPKRREPTGTRRRSWQLAHGRGLVGHSGISIAAFFPKHDLVPAGIFPFRRNDFSQREFPCRGLEIKPRGIVKLLLPLNRDFCGSVWYFASKSGFLWQP